jgi:hypothetical protein
MKIPESTNILGVDVRTVYDDGILGDDTLGLADYNHAIIFLKKLHGGLPVPDQILVTMYFHEVLHHIDLALNLKLKEDQIARLAVALHQVLTDNEI